MSSKTNELLRPASLRRFSRKKSLLVICKILGLFVNTFTADGKYFILNRDNLV